jgi:nucleoid-associated protein YgaU
MSQAHDGDSAYVSELKSLLKDKFFMLLLGISVAIVLLSTFYSFIRPKPNGEVSEYATSTDTVESTKSASLLAEAIVATVAPSVQPTATPEPSPVAQKAEFVGLEEISPTPTSGPGLFESIKQYFFGNNTATESATQTDTNAGEKEALTPTTAPLMQKKETGLSSPQTYTVAEGESLWSIAQKVYGSGYNYHDIVTANKIMDPNKLLVGQQITLPAVQARLSTAGQIVDPAAVTKNMDTIPATYKVAQGDTLWSIAATQYANGYAWTKISVLNQLTNPHHIAVGQVLKLK